MKCSFPIIIILLFLFPPESIALERFDIITTAEMKQMLTDRKNGRINFLLVNGLDKMIYNHAAIPGSINIPLSSYKQCSSKLGTQKDQLIVPY